MNFNSIIGALKTPISFFTGNKVIIALIIIIFALIAAFSVTVIVYTAEIKSLKADLKEEQLQGILLQDSLTSANIAIDKQNKAIKDLQINQEKASLQHKQALQNIQIQKDNMIKYTTKNIQDNNSCENILHIIKQNQEEFLNGRASDYFKIE